MPETAEYVVLHDLPHEGRALVRCSGQDARRFLQGLLSADVDTLGANEALASALLTTKGKLISDAIVVELEGGELGLFVPTERAEEVRALLERFVVMDEVEVHEPERDTLACCWPAVAPSPGVQTWTTRHPAPGTLVYGSAQAVAEAVNSLRQASAAAWASYRIQTASPAWGRELVADMFPPEVGFVHAVAYDKGCFLGQEPLARIHARGHVNRVMVRLESQWTPAGEGPVLLVTDARPEAGRWTTWASLADGRVHGLAIVHRSAIGDPTLRGEGGLVSIISEPLGSDVGMRARKP